MRALHLSLPTVAVIAAAATLAIRAGRSQPAPAKLVVGIYAPTVEFSTAAARLQYAQGLAKAIAAQTDLS